MNLKLLALLSIFLFFSMNLLTCSFLILFFELASTFYLATFFGSIDNYPISSNVKPSGRFKSLAQPSYLSNFSLLPRVRLILSRIPFVFTLILCTDSGRYLFLPYSSFLDLRNSGNKEFWEPFLDVGKRS